MPDTTKEDESEGSRMIREIQEQRRREESAEANSIIRKIQAQQKLARRLMYEADPRTRVKPAPSSRQLTKKLRASYQVLSNQLNRQLMDEVRYRFRDTQHIKPNPNKKHTV
jgi:hypothetical protein